MLENLNEIENKVLDAIRAVVDPELFISVVDLGLIYEISVDEKGNAYIKMTYTSMACPAGPQMRTEIYESALSVDGIKEANVEVVWLPRWDPREMASEDAKMELGIYD